VRVRLCEEQPVALAVVIGLFIAALFGIAFTVGFGAAMMLFCLSAAIAFVALLRRMVSGWFGLGGDPADRLQCRACGYDLRGSTGAFCPECGELIPLKLRKTIETMQLSREPGASPVHDDRVP